MHDLVLRDARLWGGSATDIAIEGGVIVAVGPGAARGREERRLDGRVVLPGLWDAHVHFTQWARTLRRLDVSAARSAVDVCDAVRSAVVPADSLLVAFGFRWGTWAEPPTLAALDAARIAPTVVLSGDLHTSWVNSAAAVRLDLPGAGLLREDAAFAAQRVLDAEPVAVHAVAAAVAAASARGVVGIVELEMADNVTDWTRRIDAGIDGLRVRAGFYPDMLEGRVREGARTGLTVSGSQGLLTHGPLKVITDGSLSTLTAHCMDPYPGGGIGVQNVSPDQLVEYLRVAAAAGLQVAVHAIGDRANTIALDAFAATGAHGTIEHAQLVTVPDLHRFAPLGVTASVQPEHALDDRDVADQLWAGRTGRSFPLRALLDAGARLTLGSDAPVAPLDPWISIAAAVHRTRDHRPAWHPEQAISVEEAILASVRSSVAPGQPADLVALDADPGAADAAVLRAMPVALTLVAGRVTHDAS
ncbi:amidohydrolase family protein [Demequina sp.]|uniref:amidohydrolase n=1 Tax=Demequina sp. TaxID=2050685 RepID=UPI0025FDDBEF|nr:amidohydrolase family protein [Demequina sp.]